MKNNFQPNLQRDSIYGESAPSLTFEEKVKSMTAKEIILAMIDSLTLPPTVNVQMDTFGTVAITKRKGIFGFFMPKVKKCYGCAATNTICKIAGVSPFVLLTPGEDSHLSSIDSNVTFIGRYDRADNIKADRVFLGYFEDAIDNLRCGRIYAYNSCALTGGFAEIVRTSHLLPRLENNYTSQELDCYRRLANDQGKAQTTKTEGLF